MRRFTATVETNLIAIGAARRAMEVAGDHDFAIIANLAQFIDLFTLDFTFVAMDHSREGQKWRQGLYGRIVSLMIVECLEDFGELLGKTLRTTLVALKYNPNVLTTLGEIHGDLNQLRTKHEAAMREIRNNVFGHRDLNASRQLEVMANLDRSRLVRAQQDLMTWLLRLQEFMGTVTTPLP